MNMYITPDQNTVVLWADENTPQPLDFIQSDSLCPLCSALGRSTHESSAYCLAAAGSPPCIPTTRADRRVGIFVPRRTT